MNELRFNLDDIINGELIEDILVSLRMTHNKSPIKKIYFWHNGLNAKCIDDFTDRFNKIFDNDTKGLVTNRLPDAHFVWFDIISDTVNGSMTCLNRFSYIYPSDQKSQMLLGIHNFYQVYNYIETHPKSRRILYDKNKERNQ